MPTTSQIARIAALEAALSRLVNAKALSGVRGQVAGRSGEKIPGGPYKERHPSRLGAILPRTTCGAVCELDEAMRDARRVLSGATGGERWRTLMGGQLLPAGRTALEERSDV